MDVVVQFGCADSGRSPTGSGTPEPLTSFRHQSRQTLRKVRHGRLSAQSGCQGSERISPSRPIPAAYCWLPIAFLLLLSGCGTSDATWSPDGSTDSATADLLDTQDLAGAASPQHVLGRRIIEGSWYVFACTSDDFLAAVTSDSLAAIALESGDLHVIANQSVAALVRGKIIFAWTAGGDLTVWNSELGVRPIAQNSVSYLGAASDDGQFVFATANRTGPRDVVDLLIARADGLRATNIARAVVSNECAPKFGFVGTTLAVLYCPESIDAGTPTRQLLVVDAASGLVQFSRGGLAALPFGLDVSGRRVLLSDDKGRGFLQPLDGASSAVDLGPDVADGFVSSDSSAVVFRTFDGSLRMSSLAAPGNSSLLVKTGVNRLHIPVETWEATHYWPWEYGRSGVSPGGTWLLYSTSIGDSETFDLNLASAATATDVVPLVASNSSTLQGASFSDDSANVYFRSDCRPGGLGRLICRFNSQDINGSNRVARASDGYLLWIGRQRSVAYNDHFLPTGSYRGRADIFFDSGQGEPLVVARQAEAQFALNQDRSKLLYSLIAGRESGIYMYALP